MRLRSRPSFPGLSTPLPCGLVVTVGAGGVVERYPSSLDARSSGGGGTEGKGGGSSSVLVEDPPFFCHTNNTPILFFIHNYYQ